MSDLRWPSSWAEQRAEDDSAFRAQLAYLLERSGFYREKLGGLDETVGLDEIAGLPLTDKSEIKATCTSANPIGAHLCVPMSEVVRVYSTRYGRSTAKEMWSVTPT